MMNIQRLQQEKIAKSLKHFPVVAILGARQVGKTTLAKSIATSLGTGKSVYLDLENPADATKLNEAQIYFADHADKLIIVDEIQLAPHLFPLLRSVVDAKRKNGRFLILGSASQDLINKSSQSLAGRIFYHELPSLSVFEIGFENLDRLWLQGGFPDAYLSRNIDLAANWTAAFVKTFLERDLGMLGFRLSPTLMRRVWTMLAHNHGSTPNYSALGNALDVSHNTIRHWIDAFADTYMLRILQPWAGNVGKRLVKSPKIYLRDSGILHHLLRIFSKDELLSNPVLGASWEGFVIEQIAAVAPENTEMFFYRTATGNEIDLLIQVPKKGLRAVEIKRSLAPTLGKGFYHVLETVAPHKAFVVYSGKERYRISQDVAAIPLHELASVFD